MKKQHYEFYPPYGKLTILIAWAYTWLEANPWLVWVLTIAFILTAFALGLTYHIIPFA